MEVGFVAFAAWHARVYNRACSRSWVGSGTPPADYCGIWLRNAWLNRKNIPQRF